ncbi:MAG: DUF1573 domain-containing protein [Candidatus Hydrogenedentes bacterium]|nr:DUF1573 domain-containing protein [Candidatus Hydrogenedentota bacterium]
MRQFVILFAVIISLVTPAWAVEGISGKLVEPNQDHGTVLAGSVVKGKFYVENTGTVPFKVTDAKPTCHCTTAVVSKEVIQPGGRGEISYEVTTAAVGKNVKNIRIVTDPPLPEQLIFTSSVTFAPIIETDTQLLTVDVNQGEPASVRLPLRIAKDAGNVTILGATTRSRGVQVAIETAANGGEKTLVVSANETLPTGKRPVPIEIEFDRDGKAAQNLNLTFNVIPMIQITPAPLQVKFEEGKDEATIPLTLKHTKGKPFTIASIEAKVCAIKEVALPKEAAAEQKIDLTFLKQPGRMSRGFLTIAFGEGVSPQSLYVVFPRDLSAAITPNASSQPATASSASKTN